MSIIIKKMWAGNLYPKQGDKVWVRNHTFENWKEQIFCANYGGLSVCENVEDHAFDSWVYITTTDPYVPKYTLTPKEALVAIGHGKLVRGDNYCEGVYALWSSEFGLCSESVRTGTKKENPIHLGQMYAIVEE